MKRVCGWCKKVMDPGQESDGPNDVSHGICDNCAFHLHASMGMELHHYLDKLPATIAVVDEAGKVVFANKATLDFLQKKRESVLDLLGGTVFECKYSYLPEGCGKTEHCKVCGLRNAVLKTFHTEESQENVKVVLHRQDSKLGLDISTEKAGDIVFIKVNNMEPYEGDE